MIFQTIYDRPPDGRTIPGPVSLAAAGQASQPGGIGGFLSRLGHRFMAPNDYGPNLGAKLTRFGAELQDINDGGNRAAAIHQRMEAERQQQAEAARRAQLSAAFKGSMRQDGSFDQRAFMAQAAEQGLIGDVGDISAIQRMGVERKLIETDEGLYSWDPETNTGEYVEEFEPEPRPAPMGMVRDETGKLVWEPGYVEAQAQLTGSRRDAVIARPAPSRARARPSARPSGARPAAPARAPWERDW